MRFLVFWFESKELIRFFFFTAMISILSRKTIYSPANLIRFISTVKRVIPKPSGPAKDEAIPHSIITVVDSVTNTLLPPISLSSFLSGLDRSRYSLLLVDGNHEPVICKVIDKKAEYAKAQAKKVAGKAGVMSLEGGVRVKAVAGPPKEIQLSFAVQSNDLGHKLTKAKDLLAKGNRLTIILAHKKGQDIITKQNRAALIQNIIDQLSSNAKLIKTPIDKGESVMLEFKRLE